MLGVPRKGVLELDMSDSVDKRVQDSKALSASVGREFGGRITKHYGRNQVQRKYLEAIEAEISEDDLVADIQWMRQVAKDDGDVAVLLRVWKFIMEYTVGKPVSTVNINTSQKEMILDAIQAGAEYMVLPPEGDDDEADK